MKNEPQLSAEMEKRLMDLLPLGLDDWLVEDIKHFISTALEEQKQAVLAEVEGWLVDEFIEDVSWRCPKCQKYVGEGRYCTYDRSKPIKEVYKWADLIQEGRNNLRAELRAKVQEMKEGK